MTFNPVRALGMSGKRTAAPRGRGRLGVSPALAGRWSLLGDLREQRRPEQKLRAISDSLLARYGVLTREAVTSEQISGGFVGLYPVLRAFEDSGRARRGYFVEGLGGSQFALPGAADRLRSFRDGGGGIIAMAATDPANPYGSVLPWPHTEARLSRVAGAYVVLQEGELVLYLHRGGRSLVTMSGANAAHIEILCALAGVGIRMEIREVDGMAVRDSPLVAPLGEAGFSISPRGMVRWVR